MTPDIAKAQRRAEARGRQIRVVGAFGTQDMSVLEDRMTGERRRVPNKWILLAKSPAVAFELMPAGPGFEDEAPIPDEE
jgi:hypothetical protein